MTPSQEPACDDVYNSLFRIGMVWRAAYGFFRIVLGIALLPLVGTPLSKLFFHLMHYEIIENPYEFIAHTFSAIHHKPIIITYFLACYFIFWGFVDLVLSISLLKRRLWAYPVMMYLIIAFVLYEIFRFYHTHSLILLSVMIFDVVLVWLINKEYARQLRTQHTATTAA